MDITSTATHSQRSPNITPRFTQVERRGPNPAAVPYWTTQLLIVIPAPHVVVHADEVATPIGLG
jgi:hypothetical protein